jgi:small subunit ribosomal protein S2
MAVISMKALLEAGVHFGHRTRRWNPKMQPFIFTERNGIHIIDLQQTIASLEAAYNLTRDAVAEGGLVLFVGTKKQAQENIATEAERCGMPYINQRWLGGTLTNWRTIRQRIDYLLSLEIRRDRGEFAHLPKKEALQMEREIVRLNRRLSGLKTMRRLPDVVFITDTRREAIAVKEANILSIPIVAMVDTNCDPDPIDYAIPSNDDAIRAIKLITSKIADAVVEGQQIQEAMQAEEEAEGELVLAEEEEMEKYLGPATLAKLRATSAAEEEEEEEEAAAAAGEGAYPGSRQQARAGSLARRAGEAEELEQDEREPISEEELEEAYSDEEYDYDDEEE